MHEVGDVRFQTNWFYPWNVTKGTKYRTIIAAYKDFLRYVKKAGYPEVFSFVHGESRRLVENYFRTEGWQHGHELAAVARYVTVFGREQGIVRRSALLLNPYKDFWSLTERESQYSEAHPA